jgi:hypothetical protein
MDLDKSIIFLTLWIANSITLLLLSEIFKKQIVLGNSTIAGAMSAVVCSFIFTLVLYVAPHVTKRFELIFKEERIYIILNAFLLIPFVWISKKLSLQTGLGLSNNFIILIVVFALSLVYFYTAKYSLKYLNKLGSS